jgi:hypothetical protein
MAVTLTHEADVRFFTAIDTARILALPAVCNYSFPREVGS